MLPGRAAQRPTEADAAVLKTFTDPVRKLAPMYDEIRQFREACGDAHMKTILAIGELGTFTNVYKASMVAMMAGQSQHSLLYHVSVFLS
ncbi:deoxyribose-phosphate aldolase [Lates japonicus]|uniref:deoxyribose-phosphate aldolase n=1 Tax=Lates japonicus TaxID=270547 RepID=A0AAD3MEW4_LATJO|nr:deoxyribose-phosphate aldolase [Lates japonicus]